MAVDPRVQASARERNLERQLRETQATIPQLTLQVSAADTARDQAEATLRNTRADFDGYVLAVSAGVVAGDLEAIKDTTNGERTKRDLPLL